MQLSKQSPDFLWVACSDGRVFHVNWTKSGDSPNSFRTKSSTANALSVVTFDDAKTSQDALLVVESDKAHRLDVWVYLDPLGENPQSKKLLSLKKAGTGLQLLQSSEDGRFLAGALNDRIFIGALATESVESFDDFRYDFFSFDAPDLITSVDVRTDSRKSPRSPGKKAKARTSPVVDVVVGGARGGIYVYHDAVSRLQALGGSKADKDTIEARKYHWHRRAVHCVKWSRDGK